MSDIVAGLNDGQRDAVAAPEGPVMVIAGPGSGKTRVLSHRVAYLIEHYGVAPYNILSVTFTNKAAREMQARVERLIGEEGKRVSLGTFHSICVRILRREAEHTNFTRDFAIADTTDQSKLMKTIFKNLDIDDNKYSPNRMLNAISGAKNEMISPDDMLAQNHDAETLKRVYKAYNRQLQRANLRDFDDLLTHVALLFRQYPAVLDRYRRYFQHVLVDEFQDTNMVQYDIVRQLGAEMRQVFVVGDPDQSIYAFRGADYRNIQRFRDDFEPQMVFLKQNYRSHQFILDAAMGLIRNNPDHIMRDLISDRTEGVKAVIHEAHDERDEAQYILDVIQAAVANGERSLGDFAVLYRTNAQSRVIEDTLLRANVPHILVGATRFYGRREIKDMMSFLRVIHNPRDLISLDRILNVPPRGIGEKTAQKFFAWADTLHDGTWEAIQLLANGEATPLSGRAKSALTNFAEMIVAIRKLAEDATPLEILDDVLAQTQYIEYLERDTTGKEYDRIDNIEELRRVANDHYGANLGAFLQQTALVSEVDNLTDTSDAVMLMTLHAAKGLEFPVVFIIGLEEGILPHKRSLDTTIELAEERRLMYVGITRAEDELHLTYTFRRQTYGNSDLSVLSRFLREIPPAATSGYQSVKKDRPQKGHLYHTPQFETDWRPVRREQQPVLKSGAVTFDKGQRVRHPSFGDGIVVRSGFTSGIEIVEVLFQQVGTKKLDAAFLEAIE